MKPIGNNKRALIMAGGTGGHIFPALVLAKQLREMGWDIYWLGSENGLEQQLVAPHYPIFYLPVTGIRGKGIWIKAKMLIKTVIAILQACRIIRQLNPSVLVGMGGFASGPGGIASWIMRKPLIIHEQNAVAGFTNRFLAKFSKITFAAFPQAFPSPINNRVQVVGNPVRMDLLSIALPQERLFRPTKDLRILVLGGSQGSYVINRMVLQTLQIFPECKNLAVWHQTGKRDYDEIKKEWDKNFCEKVFSARIDPFINDMASAYAWADVVIARAGALTVTEIATIGIASVLIPFPEAVDDHQFYNAQVLEKAGAAYVIRQKDLTPMRMQELWKLFLFDRERLVHMANCARTIAKPQATEKVVAGCLKVANII